MSQARPYRFLIRATLACLISSLGAQAQEANDEALRQEIARQRTQLEEQEKRIQEQADQLERLEKMVATLTGAPTSAPVAVTATPPPPGQPAPTPAPYSGPKSGMVAAPAPQPESTTTDLPFTLAPDERILDESPIAGLGRGGDIIDSDFLKSVPLFGSDWRFSLGGYMKVDLIHDFSGSGDPTQFLLSQIPVDGSPQPGSYTEFQLRESRFNFEVRDTSAGAPVNKVFLEFDFFNLSSPSSPRLRHAYFQYGHLLVGQTWTTLSELRQLPLILDFSGGDSLFGGREVQVRWEQEIDSRLDWTIALENYADNGILNANNLPGISRSNFPLLVGRIGYDWDHGAVMVGGSVGENRWDGTGVIGDESTLRWNVATGGRVYLTKDNTHFFGFGASYGEGAPRDILTFGNAGTPPAVLDANGKLHNVTSWNAFLGLHLKWSEKFSSNFHFAYAELGSTQLLPPTSIRSGPAFHGNLIYDFNEQIRAGFEYMVGGQELVNGRSGTAHRIQTGIFYYY